MYWAVSFWDESPKVFIESASMTTITSENIPESYDEVFHSRHNVKLFVNHLFSILVD